MTPRHDEAQHQQDKDGAPYRKDGVARNYLPDFVVEMADGSFLVAEIKGQDGDAATRGTPANYIGYLERGEERKTNTVNRHPTP